jgi:hypothetical protein
MSQPRHDMYTAVHKGLRARLFESSRILQGCDFADASRRGEALAHVRGTLEFLDEHAGHEDRFVQPRLADANPQLAERVVEAHQLVEQGGATVSRLVEAIGTASQEVAVERSPELCRSFNVLVSQHLAHMDEEETLANAALWQAYSDEQLRETQGALQGSIAPPRFAEWMQIMLPALNVQERVGMLMGMRAGAPPEVFRAVMQIGREAVGEPWGAVETALG